MGPGLRRDDDADDHSVMPTSSPAAVTSGPPKFPGLSAASLWITLSISRPGVGAQRATDRADRSRGGRRALEAERVADPMTTPPTRSR
jgi:hypothetical protein